MPPRVAIKKRVHGLKKKSVSNRMGKAAGTYGTSKKAKMVKKKKPKESGARKQYEAEVAQMQDQMMINELQEWGSQVAKKAAFEVMRSMQPHVEAPSQPGFIQKYGHLLQTKDIGQLYSGK